MRWVEEHAAGHEAWLTALNFPAAVRAFPELLKAKLGEQYKSWMERE